MHKRIINNTEFLMKQGNRSDDDIRIHFPRHLASSVKFKVVTKIHLMKK